MCGLVGILGGGSAGDLREVVEKMSATLRHRGPDDHDSWIDASVALGHRRLSILDLSIAGRQPMHSACGRCVLVFNGEIYNHLALRAELEGAGLSPAWRGRSDTETLLACIVAWGVFDTLRRLVGMFAFAVWDRRDKTLTLARDRFGEKPLYYGWLNGKSGRVLAFASELKALRAHPGFVNAVNRDALALYLQRGVVPAPYSIYQDVFKLPPGCTCVVDLEGLARKETHIEPYWLLTDAIRDGARHQFQGDADAVAALEAALRETVNIQSIADVHLGVFLSGGVDSSTIAALLQSQSNRSVDTFTVTFDEAAFDEAPYARAVARHLGTDHHELRVTASEAISVIPRLSSLYDEPFADSSQIPTHLICKAARQRVAVALSGEAGDEVFGGYNRHIWAQRLWTWAGWMPPAARRRLRDGVQRFPTKAWDALGNAIPGAKGVAQLGNKAKKIVGRLQLAHSADDFYRLLLIEWPHELQLMRDGNAAPEDARYRMLTSGVSEVPHRMMLWDTLTYLPDDILTKVDRAAMGVSLETRIPFLDHRVVELAWRMPLHMKLRDGFGKWALRQVLYKYVPKHLIERPKAGFAVPIGEWLRGPLRDWAESLLEENRIEQQGYLNPKPIRAIWRDHLNGEDWTARLWIVLMFQLWLEANP